MLEAVEGNIHQRLCALLDEHRARYRVMAHEAVGQCEAVSAIRGTALGRGAKALVCKVKGNGVNQHVLAILAADRQADLASLARHIGGSKARWPARRRWMPSPPACSAPFPLQFPSGAAAGGGPAAV